MANRAEVFSRSKLKRQSTHGLIQISIVFAGHKGHKGHQVSRVEMVHQPMLAGLNRG